MYGVGETVLFNVPDDSDVKPPILLDIPEVLYPTDTTSHEAVIGSITSDTKTIRAFVASNEGKLRPTDATSTTKTTETIFLPPPVPCEYHHEHITQSQVNIKEIWINLKRISQTDLDLWTKPKILTHNKDSLTTTQRSQAIKSIKTSKTKRPVSSIKTKQTDQQRIQRDRKLTVKKRPESNMFTKNHDESKSKNTPTLSSRRTRMQHICIGAKSQVFRLRIYGLKKYKHRYQYKCIITSCARRFRAVRDWNNHHRNFHNTILRCCECQKGFKTLSARRDHVYVHKQQQLTCRNCNMKFYFPSSLQVHLISHHKKKLHKCCAAGCKKEYKYKQDFL